MQADCSEGNQERVLYACTCCAHLAERFNGDTGKSFSLFTVEHCGDKHFIIPKVVQVDSCSLAWSFICCLTCRREKGANARCGNNLVGVGGS